MKDLKQQRIKKAAMYFSPQFLQMAEIDPITAYVYNQVINGNAWSVIEQLTARVNDQGETINNLVNTYGPNYKDVIDSS